MIFNNRSYGILNIELQRVGAEGAGPKAKSQLDLTSPDLDFVSLAKGFGVPAARVEAAEELTDALDRAVAEDGPHLIEAVVPNVFSGWQLRAMPYALRAIQALPRPLAARAKRRLQP